MSEYVMSQRLSRTEKITVPFHDNELVISVDVKFYWSNDGAGSYEYWGFPGTDYGDDYVEIESIIPIFQPDDSEEVRQVVQKFIDEDGDLHETLSSQIQDNWERGYPEPPEPDDDFDFSDRADYVN